jgi:hypothetical protein
MRLLSSLPALCCCTLAVLAGCKAKSRSEGATIDTTASGMSSTMANSTATPGAAAAGTTATSATASAAPMKLSDLAGRWEMRSVADSGKDTTAVTYTIVAKADSTGWTVNYPNRKPVPMKIVAMAGDSIVTEAGPFESVRRKSVQVRTHNVLRREGDRLVGTTVAHYKSKGADSVMTYRSTGMRETGAAK